MIESEAYTNKLIEMFRYTVSLYIDLLETPNARL